MSSSLARAWSGQQLSKLGLSDHVQFVAQFQTTIQTAVTRLSAMARDSVRSGIMHGRQLGAKVKSTERCLPSASSVTGRVSGSDSASKSRLLLKSRISACRTLRTSPRMAREGFSRSYNTSRPLRAQPELSESDLAHIAAQRQVEAASSPGLLRPMMFTIFVTASAWISAEYWRVNKYFIHREWRQQKRELYEKLGLPDPYPSSYGNRIEPVNRNATLLSRGGFLDQLTPAQKMIIPIVAVCSCIYGLWQFPVFGLRWMYKNFTHIPDSGISRTLLTSAFSHATLLHLAFNMIALQSFSEAAYPLLGPEYFLATVASGAVIASMAQHVYGTVTTSNPALGASGFVFSIVTYVALSYPNNQALLFFVIPASLMTLLQGLVVFDLVGLTGLYNRFNFRLAHAAHLGGVTLGAAVWWLHQRENRRKLANALPEEAVGLYNKSYDAIIKRYR